MSKPVVLIAEQLSPATIDALGPDFDVRHVDGTGDGAAAGEMALDPPSKVAAAAACETRGSVCSPSATCEEMLAAPKPASPK